MKKYQKVFNIAVAISCYKLGDYKEFILLFVMCMHMLLCAQKSPEEDIRFPFRRIGGGSEPPDMGAKS